MAAKSKVQESNDLGMTRLKYPRTLLDRDRLHLKC